MENFSKKQRIHVMIDKDGKNIKFGGGEVKPLGECLFDFVEDLFSHPYFKENADSTMSPECVKEIMEVQKKYGHLVEAAKEEEHFLPRMLTDQVGRSQCIAGLGIETDEDGQIWSDYLVMGIEDCLYIELREMILRQCRIRQCKNCGKYFVAVKNNMDYCRRILEDGEKRCSEAGYSRTFSHSMQQDELLLAYTRAYKAHYARMATPRKRAANMTREAFEAWYAQAKAKLSMARRGEISSEDFVEWLRK